MDLSSVGRYLAAALTRNKSATAGIGHGPVNSAARTACPWWLRRPGGLVDRRRWSSQPSLRSSEKGPPPRSAMAKKINPRCSRSVVSAFQFRRGRSLPPIS
jgi:hypothetical protein